MKSVFHGIVLVVVDEPVEGVTVGMVGIDEVGATTGDTVVVGTADGGLTPRLPIS
jgi:microcompartment protein CcmK/EutM